MADSISDQQICDKLFQIARLLLEEDHEEALSKVYQLRADVLYRNRR